MVIALAELRSWIITQADAIMQDSAGMQDKAEPRDSPNPRDGGTEIIMLIYHWVSLALSLAFLPVKSKPQWSCVAVGQQMFKVLSSFDLLINACF